MVYFLYGPDTYRSRKKLKEIVGEFERKGGGALGLTRIDAEENPAAVLEVGRAVSLFSVKELVVVANAVAADERTSDYLRKNLKAWSEDRGLTVIFWEGEADAEEPLVKEILKHAAKSQEFKKLSPAQLDAWLAVIAAEKNLRLDSRERRILIERFGPDLWAMANEVDKIAAGWQISQEVREEEKIWNFTDVFLKNPRSAFRPLISLLEAGYETYYLVGALAGALRNLTVVWYGLKTGEIKKAAANLNPYVARKNVELARGLVSAKLKDFWTRIAEADLEIKTGRLPPPLPLYKLLFKRL